MREPRHQVFFRISFLSLNFFTKQTWWNLTNPAISLLKNKKWLLLYKEFLLQGQGSHFIICLLLIAFYGVKDLHLYPCYLYSIYQYHLIIHPSFSGFRVWGSKHGKNNSLSILYSNFIGHLCCKAQSIVYSSCYAIDFCQFSQIAHWFQFILRI